MSRFSDVVVVLRKRPYREQDALILLLTRDHGKMSAVARGARSSKGRLVAATEPLAVSQMALYQGRSSLLTVTEAELVSLNGGVRRDLARTGRAAMLADLADELTSEHDPVPSLYDALVASLEALGGPGDPTPVYLAAFWRFMECAGLKPDFRQCQQCGQAWRDPPWFWRGGTGPVDAACRNAGDQPLPPAALHWLRLTDRERPDGERGRIQAGPAVYAAVEQLERDFLTFHVGRVPRAFRFWDEVGGVAAAGATAPPPSPKGLKV